MVAGPVLQPRTDRADSVLFTQLLDTTKPRNQSIEALLLTLGVYAEFTKYYVVAIAMFMLGMLWLVSKKAVSLQQELLLCSAFVVWHLIIPPISEGHYFGILIMPVTILLGLLFYYDQQKENVSHYKNQKKMLILTMVIAMIFMNFNATELLRPLCIVSLGLYVFLIYHIVQSEKMQRT